MKLHFILNIFLSVCINTNVFATTIDTVCLKCSGQSCTAIATLCSCQAGSLSGDIGFDMSSSDFTNINPSSPESPTINPDRPSDNNDSVITDTNSGGSVPPPSEVVSLITLIVNDFNNILSEINNSFTLISIIIGIFGLLIGVLGILGFSNLKTDYRELKKELVEQIDDQHKKIQEEIDVINRIQNDVETRTNEINGILRQQNYQIQCLQRNNQYLFSVTNSIVDSSGGNSERTLSIRNGLYNQYYILKTFLPWSDGPTDSTQAAFMYLQFNGTKDNIDDLQFIADKDPDERKREKALATINYIRGRLENGQA